MKVLLVALLLAQAPQVQIPPPKPLDAPQMPQPLPAPENLKNWAPSCQRLHAEVGKCENGLKSCNQRLVDRWRKRCEHDEPHGQ